MSDGPAIIIPRRSNASPTFSVYVASDGIVLVITSSSGRKEVFSITADVADKIAGALHQASRKYQFEVIRQKGSVGGGL